MEPFLAINRVLDAATHTQPGAIRKACLLVEDCIVNNRDNLRGFFDKCFPNLLKRIFGYDDFEASWLNMVTKPGKEEDARALVSLLHPQGKLFGAMHRADAEALISFIFPVERLPGHTQALLLTATGRRELEAWPQYRGHIMGPEMSAARRPQVFLDVFTYFMFWTAFYVLRGGRSEEAARGAGGVPAYTSQAAARAQGGASQNWGLSDLRQLGRNLVAGFGHPGGPPLHRHPYYVLLRLYLEHFLPAGGPRGVGGPTGGHVLLSVLLEFWLTDVSEPVPSDAPLQLGGAAGGLKGGAPGAAAGGPVQGGGAAPGGPSGGSATPPGTASYRALSYQPPSDDLVEALIQMVRFITVVEPPPAATATAAGGHNTLSHHLHYPGAHPAAPRAAPGPLRPAQALDAWLPEVVIRTGPPHPSGRLLSTPPQGSLLGGSPASPNVQGVSRKLYRFLRRTLTHWPLPTSASLTPTVTLWLSVIAPWAPRASIARLRLPAPPTKDSGASTGGAAPPSASTGGASSSYAGVRSAGEASSPSYGGASGGGARGGAAAASSSDGSGRYTPEWQRHVLAHLPFYTILIPKFLELTYARLSFRSDAAMLDALLLLDTLAASPELLEELRGAEKAYNAYLQSPLRRPEGPYADMLAWAVDQAHDWELAATAGAGGPAPARGGPGAPDPAYRLFTSDPCSAASYAVEVLRASEAQLVRPELRSAVHEAADAVLPLASVHLGEREVAGPMPPLGQSFPRAGTWKDLHYRGDWLKRPIASYEVAPLARALVWASEHANLALGLTHPPDVVVVDSPCGPETRAQAVLLGLRKRGFRINLRPLAERQVLAWMLGLYLLFRLLVGGGGGGVTVQV